MKTLNIRVDGRVQGVGFRYFTLGRARKFNITGFVRNVHDGSVEITAQGEDDDLEDFLVSVKKGPPFAFVSSVNISEISAAAEYSSFNVTY